MALSLILSAPAVAPADDRDCSRSLSSRMWNSYDNPFAFFSGKTVAATDLIRADFYRPSDQGAVVGISSWDDTNLMGAHTNPERDILAGQPFADRKTVFFHRASHPDEFFGQLLEVHAAAGPIKKLAIVADGNVGEIYFGETALDVAYVLRNESALGQLPDDLFAPDAEIKVVSCLYTAGTKRDPNRGVERARWVFESFVRNGAKLTTCRQIVLGGLENFGELPGGPRPAVKVSKALTYLVMVPVVVFALAPIKFGQNVINSLTRDEKTKFEPIDETDILRQR